MPRPTASLNVPTGQEIRISTASSAFTISEYLGGSEPNSPVDGAFGLATGRSSESPSHESAGARLSRRRSTSSNLSSGESTNGGQVLASSFNARSASAEGGRHRASHSASSSADLGTGTFAGRRWPGEGDETRLRPSPRVDIPQYADYRYATPPPRSSSNEATSPSRRPFFDPVIHSAGLSDGVRPSVSDLSLDTHGNDEDDETPVDERDIAGLTSNIAFSPVPPRDIEAMPSSRSPRRRGGRNSFSYYPTSPVGRRRSMLESAAREIRRASIRVVNFAGRDADRNAAHIRLPDEDRGEVPASTEDTKAPMDEDEPVQEDVTPLQGYSLGIFGPRNPVRRAARALLLWPATEPVILALIIVNVVIVAIQSAPNVFVTPRSTGTGYFHTWEDWILFGLMVIFTVEIAARIIVSGFLFAPTHRPRQVIASRFGMASFLPNSLRPKTVDGYKAKAKPDSYEMSEKAAYLSRRSASLADLQRAKTAHHHGGDATRTHRKSAMSVDQAGPSMPTWTGGQEAPFQLAVAQQKFATEHNAAYLRHSWNRVDLLAVSCFWITFVLALGGWESTGHVYIFRMLSVLRAARLLTITAGTTTILHSLKRAAPLLVTVAFFVLFAMVLFSIIGVQSFKGSFRRVCVWQDPLGQQNFTFDAQHCGGQYDGTGRALGYISANTQTPVSEDAKGYICPVGQLCVEGENPSNGTVSFDNVFAAALLVVVIASANTWSDIMYSMMDADFFLSCFFFVVCLIILNFWCTRKYHPIKVEVLTPGYRLINIFVAVITDTFGSMTEQTKQSAFAHKKLQPTINGLEGSDATKTKQRRTGRLASMWRRTNLVWVALILVDISIQATRRADMTQSQLDLLKHLELYFTLAFDVEIVTRFCAAFPDWRSFLRHGSNNVDAFLALMTSIIQIPGIRDSSAYPWLTVFQIARFYRVVLAVPRMRRLLERLRGSVSGLINMIGFLVLMNFIASLMAVQFFRGDIPAEEDGNPIEMTFYQTFNSFLSVFQIFTSENWTTVLYNALGFEGNLYRVVIAALFLCGWFLFSYFILLQMFIAVINEGWAVAEEQKHKEQLRAFVNKSTPQTKASNWFTKWNPYRFTKPRPKVLAVENIPSGLVLPMRKVVVRDVVEGVRDPSPDAVKPEAQANAALRRLLPMRSRTQSTKARSLHSRQNSLAAPELEDEEQDLDRQLDLLALAGAGAAEEDVDVAHERRALQADFITAHPTYDRSLWIFSQRNRFRRLCQKLVESPHEERIHGAKADRKWTLAFRAIILVAVVGSVVIAAIATPVFRRNYFINNGDIRLTWFNLTEVALGMFFVAEFMIKVIADGFIFAPNAYLLSIWNVLDFFVLLTLLVNVTTSLVGGAGVNRFTRALNALRALRLINMSSRVRDTFYTVFIVGFSHIFDASILAILYIIPFAIWGQNIFSGLLYFCTDGSVANKAQCQGEYLASPMQWEFLAPRVWQNPQVWSYDSFRSALLIMFEIISLEGWINVLETTMSVVGLDQQPAPDASQFNAIYLVIYNLVGASVILTLFVSVIIENFTKRSGMLLMTAEQRQWIDLRKLLLRQRPSKRPRVRPDGAFRAWCYERAVRKHGWWSRMMTGLYILHIGILLTQTNGDSDVVEALRDYAFLLLTVLYTIDIAVRMTGLGWKSFRQNWWHLYDIVVVTGTLATTIPILLSTSNQVAIQLQKLFLVSIAFKLVQKNDSLNQLFKVAAASLPAIANLFILWGILFITWALLYVEVFGLTRWGADETWNKNYSSFGASLLMLVMASTGEGWNAYMHDYTVDLPLCSPSSSFLFSDCGSPPYSFLLAITWNVISMYIFVNMFTAVVVENFSSVQSKASTINREEMRLFKRAWGEIDTERNGFMKRKDYGRFFAKLTGVFDVKIYPEEDRVPAILAAARRPLSYDPPRSPGGKGQAHPAYKPNDEINIAALKAHVRGIDQETVARRRRRYSRLYFEALLSDDPRRGMSFTNMLLLLAHYKLINDEKALQLDELLHRQARTRRVEDVVHLDRVRGLLRTIHWRKKFLRHLEETRRQDAEVPAIFVQSSDPPSPSLRGGAGHHSGHPSLHLDLGRTPTAPGSPASPQLTPRSPLGGSPGDHGSVFWGAAPSPRTSEAGLGFSGGGGEADEAEGVWGGAFREALEADERRG